MQGEAPTAMRVATTCRNDGKAIEATKTRYNKKIFKKKKKKKAYKQNFFFLPVSSVFSSRQKSKLLHIGHVSGMPLCPYYIANTIQNSCIKVCTKTSPRTHTCEKYSRVLKTQFSSSLQKQPTL